MMSIKSILLFEDAATQQLAPVSLTRPAWAIRCGSFRLIDWVQQFGGKITSFVRPHLQGIQREDWPDFCEQPATGENLLMVNARLAPTVANIDRLKQFETKHGSAASQSPAFVTDGQTLVAAIVPAAIASSLNKDFATDRVAELNQLAGDERGKAFQR